MWDNRALIVALVKREVVGRYRGSILGVGWSFLRPLFLLLVYSLVFGAILQARWGGGEGPHSIAEFAIILFAGLVVFDLFSEVVNRAPLLVLANPNYVKKVVFPLEILPPVALGSGLVHLLASMIILLAGEILLFHSIPWTAVLFPLAILPLVLCSLGLAWFLASLGVYLRDVSQVTGTITTALMFLSGIFFPPSALPEAYRFLLEWNPLSWSIEASRQVLVFGTLPDFTRLGVFSLVGLITTWLGYAWFQKTRPGFADVI